MFARKAWTAKDSYSLTSEFQVKATIKQRTLNVVNDTIKLHIESMRRSGRTRALQFLKPIRFYSRCIRDYRGHTNPDNACHNANWLQAVHVCSWLHRR